VTSGEPRLGDERWSQRREAGHRMDLEHSFTVPVSVDTAWAEFQDIASVAECFPGASVTGV